MLKPQDVMDNWHRRQRRLSDHRGAGANLALTSPNPGDAWMRDWSFSSETQGQVLATQHDIFPTLNLAETARLLENVLTEAAQQHPSVVGGFTVVEIHKVQRT